ncbi:chitooligosaccharidolytic beta-N-acetylglucosaminidase-like [Sitodiplosis mosellana]|uniref:chitooligosaccharidolytic beta-N-acetylglucosaminidase-like n=1 Tax=Sitodiplosis mosellana TaxID=263140 RepID=UPI002444A046|nr:chitooligosaccharidolytic beta-N-acetylglucosaminidase-like [Sitodiplosis mosellana]
MVRFNPEAIQFSFHNAAKPDDCFWHTNKQRFHEQISKKVPPSLSLTNDGSRLMIIIDVGNESNKLGLNTNEHYKIRSRKDQNDGIVVNITSETIFGARHALETISQLIIFDNVQRELQIVGDFDIDDRPAFPHRGFMLDTVRNYFNIDAIKRTIDGMAMVKMNVFHWHISDSQSFPLVLDSHPDLSEIGAYSTEKVYTIQNIRDVYEYAYARGVLLLPEFDAPAHVGEGWQKKNVTTCFNMQPWQAYCTEPPCGQLDPTKDQLYDILEDIYSEMYEAFGRPDRFHMGGDEVHEECWNSSKEIQNFMLNLGLELDSNGFMDLWGYFQAKAVARMDKVTEPNVPIIMWTSSLTDKAHVGKYLDKQKYIIQVWTKKNDNQVKDLLEMGYKLILSNVDSVYFDCGFGDWMRGGNGWCGPFKTWDKVYENNFTYFDERYRSQFLGGEAALWSEQIDHLTLDDRTWPRLSALAERLWTDPSTSWRQAESRMLIHRERLVENGIAAENVAPYWCVQHQGECAPNEKNASSTGDVLLNTQSKTVNTAVSLIVFLIILNIVL